MMDVGRSRSIIAGIVILLSAGYAAAQDPVYALTPVHASGVDVRDINEWGDIIGQELDTYPFLAVDDVVIRFGWWFDIIGVPTALNDNREVVGWGRVGRVFRAFHYDFETATLTTLGTLGGASSQASAVNEAGVVVGSSRT